MEAGAQRCLPHARDTLTQTLSLTLTLTQVHGDVFRTPVRAGLLVVYLGTGVQVLGMAVITMAFAVFGFLSPSNRGGKWVGRSVGWSID